VLFTLEKQTLSIIELVIGGTDRIKNFQRLEGKYKSKDTTVTIYLIVILGLSSLQGTDAEEKFAAYSGEKKTMSSNRPEGC
jgi:hypothetical protein